MSVYDEKGREINLLSLWADRKIVCAFTRHMGCRFCKEQTNMLEKVQAQLNSSDVVSMIITIGSYSDIPKFRAETGFTGEIYVDTNLTAPVCYNMLNLKHGREVLFKDGGDTFHAETVQAGERAKDFSNGGYGTETSPYNGDIMQIGGIFVLGPGNTCDYSFRCSFVGDVADLTEVLEAATGVSATGEEVVFAATSEWNQKLRNDVKISLTTPSSDTDSDTDTKRIALPTAETSEAAVPAVAKSSSSFFNLPVVSLLLALCMCVLGAAYHWHDSLSSKQQMNMLGVASLLSVALCVYICIHFFLFTDAASEHSVASASAGCPFSSAQRSGGEGEEEEEVVLHTIRDIDKLVLQHGSSTLSNSFMSTINMDTFAGDVCRGRTFSLLDEDGEEDATGSSAGEGSRHEALVSTSPGSLEPLEATQAYVREFLAKPNPNLGRKGPTCPFVPTSLKFDCLYLGLVSQTQTASMDALEAVVLAMLQRFKTLEPRENDSSSSSLGRKPNPKVPYKAIILICPHVALADAPMWIDRLQRKLQPLFVVENALMLGEFHKNNNSSGLHNESFFPLRTPFPCLAMRNMVPSDIVFLNCPDYPLQTRLAMIRRYLDTFCVAGKTDSKDILKAQEMMQILLAENTAAAGVVGDVS